MQPSRPGGVTVLPLVLALLSSTTTLRAQTDPQEFARHIRTTPPLLPEEELETFRLPEGFEIQLFASEPAIHKPMNLAFDASGRLWVSTSTEYPFPAPEDGPARDSIRVLEDLDGDGRADNMSVFAEGLNIPIGLYPYKNGVIAWSIPHIWFFEDLDGDLRADRRRILYGPFDYSRDTHGMNNAFRRGFDGWLYACHGFNNHTEVSGADGHTVRMQSGNTYRVRLDGSRIEHYTWGQVNPFGRTLDPLGNQFTADCHSRPLTQIVRGGYYPSFGRPHDGLGFVPPMMDHLHGSTAICGVVFYADDAFPPEYRGNLFVGNVMTSRVNRDTLEYSGATIRARKAPDFVATSDPWFRPVDLRLGPEGAIYIADFYNRIIGHYEVPLTHPGRDRHRGRIWRVVYRGKDGDTPPTERLDLAGANATELIEELDSANLQRRMLATDELTDRLGTAAVDELKRVIAPGDASDTVEAHALWALFRLGALSEEELVEATRSEHRLVRVHAQKILAEMKDWSEALARCARAGLRDADALVRLRAADALGRHPDVANVPLLLELVRETPDEDAVLGYKARQALRDQLREESVIGELDLLELDPADARRIADLLPSIASPAAARLLAGYLASHELEPRLATRYLRHAARHIAPAAVPALVEAARRHARTDRDLQLTLFDAVRKGIEESGEEPPANLVAWGEALATELLQSIEPGRTDWETAPVPGKRQGPSPWVVETRRSADGDRESRFFGSLPRGEQLTGILRSAEFEIPEALRFHVAGHIGRPGEPVVAMNFVRLRSADGTLLKEARPPRNDTAQPIVWDLSDHAGSRGYLELVDGDHRDAYAWLAVGRFEPPVVRVSELDLGGAAERLRRAREIIGALELASLGDELKRWVSETKLSSVARAEAARSLLALQPSPLLAALVPVLGAPETAESLRSEVAQAFRSLDAEKARELLDRAVQTVPATVQRQIALELSQGRRGAELLVELVARGRASARLLEEKAIRDRLVASGLAGVEERIAELTASLAERSERIDELIGRRREAYLAAAPEARAERGRELFEAHCAACHQIAGQGQVVGPQLDGIGNRGLDRLLEDLFDPNRNVDIAFRTTTYVLKSGQVVSGLFRREEGQTLIIVDGEGQEKRLARDDVLLQEKTTTSPMPESFDETIPPDQLPHLLKYLLAQREVE